MHRIRETFRSTTRGYSASNQTASHILMFSAESISAYLEKRVTDMLMFPTEDLALNLRNDADQVGQELMTLFSNHALFAPDAQFEPEQQFDPNETRFVKRDDVAASVGTCFVARYRDVYKKGLPSETLGVQGIEKHEITMTFGGSIDQPAPKAPAEIFWTNEYGSQQNRIIYVPPSVSVCWEDRAMSHTNHVRFKEPRVGNRTSVAEMKYTVQRDTVTAEGSTKANCHWL